MDKEQIYDEQISPLMAKIIGICKERGIAMVASFAIPTEEDDGLCCTTILPDENGKNAHGHMQAFRILRNERTPMMLRTDHGDGSTTMTAIL
jgi:imidazolonepropionase-like amidohydrolase